MANHLWPTVQTRTASKAQHVTSVVLLELLSQQAGGAVVPVRLCTGFYPVEWSGYSWAASGRLLAIQPVTEARNLTAQGLRIVVSSVPADLRSLALDAQYAYPGRPLRLYEAVLDTTTYAVLGTDIVFAGYIDKMTIREAAGTRDGTSEVTITAESKYARLRMPNERRMSDEQQRALYPADTGLRFLARMKEDNTAVFGQR